MMKDEFFAIADEIDRVVPGGEIALLNFRAEESDFARFNQGKLRQGGSVTQRELNVELVSGQRHAAACVTLSGDLAVDQVRAKEAVAQLRELLEQMPDDPHLAFSTEVRSSTKVSESRLFDAKDVVSAILHESRGTDLVGIYAGGAIHAGFANSLGQRNWYTSNTFNFDFSVYHQGDKAVKASYAGFEWRPDVLSERIERARRDLELLTRPARLIPPGTYRAYLAPTALREIFDLLAWDSWGLKAHRSRQTSLLRLASGDARLHPSVSIEENHAAGVGPDFQAQGFVKPVRIPLVAAGRHAGCLVSPRSAREFGEQTTGASASESPESLEMSAGELEDDDLLVALDTGLYVNHLWYANFSDRSACRVTGMTRFATFWVERGRVVAPVDVMRFDDSLYRMLGEVLLGLSRSRELILDADTYFRRSTRSVHLPGALVSQLTLTL